MSPPRYEYDVDVSRARTLASGRYGHVAAVRDLRCVHDDGRIERLPTPFGEYHGEDAHEAEGRAREAVARWIEAQST